MAVFKRKRRMRRAGGKMVVTQSAKWYVKYRDAEGIVRCVPGYTDKEATKQLEARLIKEAALASEGIVDAYKEHRARPLKEHLADFRQALLDKGDTEDHARLTHNRVSAVLSGCKFLLIGDVQASRIQRYLAERRQSGLSIKSCNYHLTAAKNFFNWMVADKRTCENPVAHLKGQNANTDIRRARRPLEPDEIRLLLETAAAGPVRFGMSGNERSLLYRFAAETGLRANEIRKLRVEDFDFARLTVTVKAAYSKHRREDTQPLKPDTAARLREFFADKLPSAKAFGGEYKQLTKRTSEVVKADLADAGIPFVDAAGRYADFHSLRHTTGSLLAASGVHPKVAQSIMRHSDINLTMSRYSHVLRGQESEAIAGLPDLSLPSKQSQQAKATGTDDSGKWTPKWTPEWTPTAFSGSHGSAAIGKTKGESGENPPNDKSVQDRDLGTDCQRLVTADTGEREMGRTGVEPATHGFSVRCSTN
jgi:integrase